MKKIIKVIIAVLLLTVVLGIVPLTAYPGVQVPTSLTTDTGVQVSLTQNETCQEYLERRLSEGWKVIEQEGYNVVLLSPEGIRRELDLRNDVETLRPSADGTTNDWWPKSAGDHYVEVDEATPDGMGSYVIRTAATKVYDLYNLPDSSGSGTINSVSVKVRLKHDESEYLWNGMVWAAVRTHATNYTLVINDIDVYFITFTKTWVNNPNTSSPWTWDEIDALEIGIWGQGTGTYSATCTQAYVEVNYTPVPTVTTQAATSIEDTTATGNGNITNTGGENCDIRGIVWDLGSHGDPGNVSPAVSDYANDVAENGSFGTGAFTRSLISLPTGDTIYARAYAHNSEGYSYGAEVNFLTKPAAPTNVAATENQSDKVTVTWTKSDGATGYKVYEGINLLDTLGDVATYDDTNAAAPTITPGTAVASDGTSALHVALNLDGESTSNGATRTYKVVALNATGDSDDSGTDTGYRIPGALTYQWHRSSGDADNDYSEMDGVTTEAYNDTGAPVNGDGRYYKCVLNATGAVEQTSGVNRGFRLAPPLVTTGAVDDIEGTTATANGEITNIGKENADLRGFVWDTSEHGDPGIAVAPGDSDYTWSWTEGGDFGAEVFDHGLTSLTKGELYYVRACAHNSDGWRYGDEVTFLTKPDAPFGFSVSLTSSGVLTLNWSKGSGAQKTYVRGKDGGYPANRGPDGYEVYYDTETTDTDTGLTGGHTYYYRLWSYAIEGAKEQYSESYTEGYALAIVYASVTTNPTDDIGRTYATFDADITATGNGNCDTRGFVWDTTGHGDPGNTAPGASDYTGSTTEGGSFGITNFTHAATGLNEGDTYYVRGCAHNDVGWSYGAEVEFDTLEFVLYFQPVDIIVNTGYAGTADADSDADTIIDDALDQVEDYWLYALVTITNTDNHLAPEGESRYCSAFTAASDEVTVGVAFSAAVEEGDSYTIDFGTLIDRAGDYNGIISWGVNPDDLATTFGGIEPYGQPIPGVDEPESQDIVSPHTGPGLFAESAGVDMPGYEFFKYVSDGTSIPIQILWFSLGLMSAIVVGIVFWGFSQSLMWTAIASGVVLSIFTVMGDGLIPMWTIIVYAIVAVGTALIAPKVVSL